MGRTSNEIHTISFEEYLIKSLKNPEKALGYWQAAMEYYDEEKDYKLFEQTMRDLAEANVSFTQLARAAHLESYYDDIDRKLEDIKAEQKKRAKRDTKMENHHEGPTFFSAKNSDEDTLNSEKSIDESAIIEKFLKNLKKNIEIEKMEVQKLQEDLLKADNSTDFTSNKM